MPLTTRSLTASALILCLCACLPAITASAQSPAPGPGPLTNVRITKKGLLFTVANGSGATPFTGDVQVSAADGAAFTPFDGRAIVKRGGAQLLQRGRVGGKTVDEYFPDEENRRIRIRNGDGAVTELDLVRLNDGFFVSYVLTTPTAPIAVSESVTREGLEVRGDAEMRLALAPSGAPAYDVAVAVRLPESPEGVAGVSTRVFATSTTTGTLYYDRGGYAGAGRVRFLHLALPEGAYTIRVVQTIEFGDPFVATGSFREDVTAPAPIQVSRQSRAFEVELPALELPALVPTRIVLGGFEPYDPSFGNRLAVDVSLSSGGASLSAKRDVGSSEPVVVEAALPAGDYSASITVRGGVSGANSATFSGSFRFDPRPLAAQMRLDLPPLVRLTGSLLDPGFVLASADDGAPEDPPFHAVGVTAGTFTGTGELTGFARSYRLFVPRNVVGDASAALEVGLGGSARGRLGLSELSPPIEFSADRELDVTVPAIPSVATLTGRVVDANGQAVPYAFVVASSEAIDGLAGPQFSATVLAGRDGAFRLRLPHGSGYAVTAVATRF